jgi:DNA repair exonuclease SbcCD nuclease subunit
MKFLFFTDSHIRGTSPRNRKDNFFETLKAKFQEIILISKELDVDYILHGGDWFDRPDISPGIVREFAVIIREFDKPIYTIAGNHDIYGQNPDTIGRTMLGLLEGIGLMQMIGYDDEIILEKEGVRVQLTGKSFNYDIDGANFRDYYVVKKRSDVDYAINIVHGMLLNKPFFEGIQYTLIDDIKDTGADITLAGHYHSGFGIKRVDSRYFINPGSIVRVSNSLNEISRKPKVVLIELKDRIYTEEIELKCALNGDEVLDRSQLENAQSRTLKLFQFYQGLESTDKFRKIDLDSILAQIASDSQLSSEVREEAVRRITSARERLSSGEEE